MTTMLNRIILVGALALGLNLVACSDEEQPPAADGGSTEASVSDATLDWTPPDTMLVPDTLLPDLLAGDSAPAPDAAPLKDTDGDGDPDITDCAPGDKTVAHGNPEICGNGKDDNCVDEGPGSPGALGCINYYVDKDKDGYGAGDPKCLCEATGDYTATVGGDCADGSPMVNPGFTGYAPEADKVTGDFDYDCDGQETKEPDLPTSPVTCTKISGALTMCNCTGAKTNPPACGQLYEVVLPGPTPYDVGSSECIKLYKPKIVGCH